MKASTNTAKFLLGNAYIMLATIFWGVNYPFTKALVPTWMTANAVSAVRIVGGCILFWLVSLFLKPEKLDRSSLVSSAIGGAIGLFGCIYLFVISLEYGSAIDIAIIMTLPPVFVILMEVLFMHRRPTILEYVGIVLSFIGAAMVILGRTADSGSASNYLLGDALAVASSACFALYLVVLAKPSKTYRPISLLRWVFLFSALPGLFLVPDLLHAPLLRATTIAPWLEIAFILFCPTFLAYLLTQPAIKDIGPVPVSLYQYLTPVVAAITAMLMGVEQPRWQQGFAMLVIIGGMIMTNIGKKRKDKNHAK